MAVTADAVDILIVGGGLVGLTLARAFDHAGLTQHLSIALVEPCPLIDRWNTSPSFDDRTSALSWNTHQYYQILGVWDDLAPFAQAINQVHISERGGFGSALIDAKEQGQPALGYVTKNHAIGDALCRWLQQAKSEQRITVFNPDEVQTLTPSPRGMTAQLNEQIVDASLVILADGGRSPLLTQLGISSTVHDYQQTALIANVALDRPHHGRAWERFAGDQTLALLPLPADEQFEHRAGLVWSLPNAEQARLTQFSDEAMLAHLQKTFGDRAGRFLTIGARDFYPLKMQLASEQVRPGLAIVGNAAHAIHPVAGQGYNLSIADIQALCGNVAASVAAGEPAGNLTRLLAYQQQQLSKQGLVTQFCHYLVEGFGRQGVLSKSLRSLGLFAFQYSGGIKRHFAHKAMGL